MYHRLPESQPAFLRDPAFRTAFRGRRVLVLGGDGFLGSYVATALEILGAEVAALTRRPVSVLDGTSIRLHRGELRRRDILEPAMADREIVFDLAGSSGAVDSNRDALRNLAEECEPHLNAFQIAAGLPKPPRVVFCSSRTVYGRAPSLPVAESNRVAPESIYAVHKLTLEHYLQSFAHSHRLDFVVFRLSNPYGPLPQPEGRTYGVLNQFIHRALHGDPIRIFGDGHQRRDYIHVDDVVEAFLRGATTPEAGGQIFNLGGPESISIREAVEALLEACPGSPVVHEPWPKDYFAVETGDYATDNSKLQRTTGFTPAIGFREGIRRTLAAYRSWANVNAPTASPRTTVSPPRAPSPEVPAEAPWDWTHRRVLITGATGFLGRPLTLRLLSLGATVAAIHRRPLDPTLAVQPNLRSLPIALESTESLRAEVAEFRPEVIFHLASRPDGPEAPDHAFAGALSNVVATVALLELARSLSVSAFVFAGSVKVYGNSPVPHRESSPADPRSSYAASKWAAWNYARVFALLHEVPALALHPTLIYGPSPGANLFTYLANCLRAGKSEIPLDGGLQTRDPLYLDDAIEAYLLAARFARRLRGRSLPIGGGRELPVRELAEIFVRAAGYDTPVRACNERLRPTEMMRSYCDNADASAALQWRPAVSVEEGLARTARFLLAPPSAPALPATTPVSR